MLLPSVLDNNAMPGGTTTTTAPATATAAACTTTSPNSVISNSGMLSTRMGIGCPRAACTSIGRRSATTSWCASMPGVRACMRDATFSSWLEADLPLALSSPTMTHAPDIWSRNGIPPVPIHLLSKRPEPDIPKLNGRQLILHAGCVLHVVRKRLWRRSNLSLWLGALFLLCYGKV
jgi:hypothetical protein